MGKCYKYVFRLDFPVRTKINQAMNRTYIHLRTVPTNLTENRLVSANLSSKHMKKMRGKLKVKQQPKIENKKRTSTSCHCTECGDVNNFQKVIKATIHNFLPRHLIRFKALHRLRAAINAIFFILRYKAKTIMKLKKKIRLLQIVKNTTIVSRKTMFIPSSQSPLLQDQSKKSSFSKRNSEDTKKEETKPVILIQEESLTSIQLKRDQLCSQQESKKSHISSYIQKMLNGKPIQELNSKLKPLSILVMYSCIQDKQYMKKGQSNQLSQIRSIGSKVKSVHSLDSRFDQLITPFHPLIRTKGEPQTQSSHTSLYSQNNKAITQMIGLMRHQNKILIRTRK